MPSRLVPLRPAEMTAPQRALYDSITSGPRATGRQSFSLIDAEGGLVGPFGPMLLSPGIGEAVQQLGAALRYGSTLTRRDTEILILTVAASWDSSFERYAHQAVARQLGFSGQELDALSAGDFDGADDHERAVTRVAAALLHPPRDLDDEAFKSSVEALGTAAVFEITCLIGYYEMLALQLRVFRIPIPPGATDVATTLAP